MFLVHEKLSDELADIAGIIVTKDVVLPNGAITELDVKAGTPTIKLFQTKKPVCIVKVPADELIRSRPIAFRVAI